MWGAGDEHEDISQGELYKKMYLCTCVRITFCKCIWWVVRGNAARMRSELLYKSLHESALIIRPPRCHVSSRYVFIISRRKAKVVYANNIIVVIASAFRVSVYLRAHITRLHLFLLSPFSHTISFTESQHFTGNRSGTEELQVCQVFPCC